LRRPCPWSGEVACPYLIYRFAILIWLFDDRDRMAPSPYDNRIVDVTEELVKFTLLTRACADYLVDRYPERMESAEELSKRVNQRSL